MSVADILRMHGKWIQASELTRLVAKKWNISDRHAYRKIKQAWKEKEIRRVVYPDLSVVYGLSEWRPFREHMQVVIKTINQWREIAFRDPDPLEIADETGLSLEEAESLSRRTRNQTGWTRPNEAIKQRATEKLGEVLFCAALLRDGEVGEDGRSENFNYDNDMEIVEAAKKFLEKHPELVPPLPKRPGEPIPWPPQALRYLGKNYRPKKRRRPVFIFE